MDLWGPYLSERAWGNALNPSEDATYEEACSSGKFLDGIFGFGNACGTVKASFAFWNGQDSHLKERLFDDRESERYVHGLVDPQYRYWGCRYTYPQTAFPYERLPECPSRDRDFDLHFELAKELPTRMFYRLTVANCASGEDAKPADLMVAAQLWLCHTECGRVEQLQGANCLGVSAAEASSGLRCLHLDAGGQQQSLPQCGVKMAPSYRLHYQPDGLESVEFSDVANPGAFNQLIVHRDRSKLSSEAFGCRAAVVYRISVPASSSVSLCFLLAGENEAPSADCESPPDWSAVPELMQRSCRLASELLTAVLSDQLPDAAKEIARRAYANILWNRQLCSIEAPQGNSAGVGFPCLVVVPDKWQAPGVSSWEHGLHAIVLCRVSYQLALAELRNQLARLSVSGEFASSKAAPPVWPLALLELLHLHDDKEASERIFTDLLRHLNWWLLDRTDEKGRNTIDGGILGLERKGWIANSHASEANDSLVWSGFFCAKMVSIAALLRRQELKPLLDLFNAVLSTLRNDVAFVGGLFRPKFAGEKRDKASAGFCCCAFGFVPLLGCATIPWDLLTDMQARVLIEWLHWLSNEVITTETPSLFVKTDANSNHFLLSWITETEFVKICATLFDPAHFLCPYGIRCTSAKLCEQLQQEQAGGCSYCKVDGPDVVSIPLNYLTLEALKCWESAYGQHLQFDYPTGSGVQASLNDIIVDISQRVLSIFLKISESSTDAPMFYELYRADNGGGMGPSRTSWSSLIANIAQNLTRQPTQTLHVAPGMPRAVGRIRPKNSAVHMFRQIIQGNIKMDDFAPDSSFDWSADED